MLAGALPLAARAAPAAAHGLAGALDAGELGVRPGLGDDQTENLRRALAEAVSRDRPLLLAPGRYVVSRLALPDGARLVGVRGATRLTAGGAGPVLQAQGARRVALADLDVEGLTLAGEDGLVRLEGVAEASVAGCGFADSAGNGLELRGCSGRVSDCSFSGAAQAALFSLDGRDLDIVGNDVRDCGNNGILVWQSDVRQDGTVVRDNRVGGIRADGGGTGQNGNGINVYRAGGVSVVGNVVHDCAFSAVRNNAGADIVIARNQCRDLGEVALYVEFAFEGAVVADNVVERAAQGISATNSAEGGRMAAISGNLIRDIVIGGVPEDRGVGIAVEADASVTGNVIDGAEYAGLALGWGPYLKNVVASGNVVGRARYGIAVSVADGAGPAVVTGNMISGSGEAAIAGFAWKDLVEPDLAGHAGDYPWLTMSANRAS